MSAKRLAKENNFFLPNFCEVKTLFVLFIGAELMALVLILATGDVLLESWDEWGLLSIFVQWIAFVSALVLCVSRRWLAKLPLLWAASSAYLLIILVTGLIAAGAQFFMIKINYQWGSAPETIGQFVTRCVAINALIALIALRYFYVQQQWKRRIQLESEAQIEALQARIRPHFLFNSMNIIASLIRSHPNLAEQAVEDLSELFRATLQEKASMVPLTQELALCHHYLRIEKLRLGDRLTVVTDLSLLPQDALIPMLTLQPLVENAIYHGIQPLEKGGAIQIVGEIQGTSLTVCVTNPVSTSSSRHTGNKIAMVNIVHRLNLLFGNRAKLKVNATFEQYEVKLFFPYLKSGI